LYFISEFLWKSLGFSFLSYFSIFSEFSQVEFEMWTKYIFAGVQRNFSQIFASTEDFIYECFFLAICILILIIGIFFKKFFSIGVTSQGSNRMDFQHFAQFFTIPGSSGHLEMFFLVLWFFGIGTQWVRKVFLESRGFIFLAEHFAYSLQFWDSNLEFGFQELGQVNFQLNCFPSVQNSKVGITGVQGFWEL